MKNYDCYDNTRFYWYNDNPIDECIVTEKIKQIGSLLIDPLEDRICVKDYVAKLIKYSNICLCYEGSPENITGIIAIYANDYFNFISFISIFGVLQEYQGKRIGCNLLLKAINLAHNKGMKEIILNVHKKNYKAIKLYHSFDFVEKFSSVDKYILSKIL